MIPLRLPPFNPMAPGVRSTIQVPRYDMTLGRIQLFLSGDMKHTDISEIVVKVGARVVWGPISGAELLKLMAYKRHPTTTYHLLIDFTERDALSAVAKEIGGLDIPALGGEDVFVEVVNTLAAGKVANIAAIGHFTSLQFDPKAPSVNGQLIHKVLKFQVPTTGGSQVVWTPQFKGALVKRIHFLYNGAKAANFESSGNIFEAEGKKNGVAFWDRITDRDARMIQRDNLRTPQEKWYTMDFVADNIHSKALRTADARSLEFNLWLKAPDQIQAIVELLDVPGNL